MKKIYFLCATLLMAQLSIAQDIAIRIPANAKAVATINTARLMKLMSPEDLDKSILGKKLREIKGDDTTSQYNSVKDFGLDLNNKLYYFYMADDSMHYNIVLMPLSDALKVDKVMHEKEMVRLSGNVRKVAEIDSSSFLIWNDQRLMYVSTSLKDEYFRRKDVAANHGLSYNYYYEEAVVSDSIMSMDTSAIIYEPDTTETVTDKARIDSILAIIDSANEATADTTRMAGDEEVIIEEAPHEGTFDYYNDIAIKKRISAARVAALANELFYQLPADNILNKASFVSSGNPEAVASFWIESPMDLYYSMIPSYPFAPGGWLGKEGLSVKADYTQFSSHLVMNERLVSIHSQMEMSKEMAAAQEKILDRKINKQFYKYINTDSMLGYMSWAVNTKNYLEQVPALMERTYGKLGFGLDSDEYGLMSELFSFLIDEEAISKMVKGDMMVLFDGVYQQQTTYTDYIYNDNFESTPVVKTKNETLPRFLMMASSEENNLAKKLVNYGMKNKTVKAVEGFYEIAVPRSPMSFYFMYKDDIFFFTNSLKNIRDISKGNYKASISKEEKKFIGNHNLSMLINPKNLAGQLASTDVAAAEGLTNMINLFNKMGTVRMKLNPIRNNVSSSDMWMEVPAGNSNALTLLLNFFEGWSK